MASESSHRKLILSILVIIILSAAGAQNTDQDDPFFTGEVESSTIEEATVELDDEGFLEADMMINSDRDIGSTVLSPGWALPENGDLQKWLEGRPFQAYFEYSSSDGRIELPEQDPENSDLKIHITEFDEEACFGVMFSTEDCFDLKGEGKEFEEDIRESSNVEFTEDGENLIASFDYEGNPYLTLRDESGVLNIAEREGNKLKVNKNKVEGNICGYVYGVEIECTDIVEKEIQILSNPVGETEYHKIYSFEDGIKLNLKGVENPQDYELQIFYDKKGELLPSKYYSDASPRVRVEPKSKSYDISQKLKNLAEDIEGDSYEFVIRFSSIEGSERLIVRERSDEKEINLEGNLDVEGSLNTGEEIILKADFKEKGDYRLEIMGQAVNIPENRVNDPKYDLEKRTIEIKDKSRFETQITPDNYGSLKVKLLAPAENWEHLDSDKLIDSATKQVEKSEEKKVYDYGDIVEATKGEVIRFGDTSVKITDISLNLLEVNGTESSIFGYEGGEIGGNHYYLCNPARPEDNNVKMTLVENKKNPFRICNIKLSEHRNPEVYNSYDSIDYKLGEKVKVTENTVLQFGENSRAYIDSIERYSNNYVNIEGYAEWVRTNEDGKKLTNTFNPPNEDSFSQNPFKEGEITTATCDVDAEENEAVLILEWSDETSDNFRDSACEGEDSGKESESRISLSESSVKTGKTVTADIKVNPNIAEKGYRLRVETGSDKEVFNSDKLQGSTSKVKFNIEEAGSYNVGVYPTGIANQVINALTGGKPILSDTLEVVEKDSALWKQECETNRIEELKNCISQKIVPNYFEESVGENPEVAESLCNDLLGYEYSEQSKQCVP